MPIYLLQKKEKKKAAILNDNRSRRETHKQAMKSLRSVTPIVGGLRSTTTELVPPPVEPLLLHHQPIHHHTYLFSKYITLHAIISIKSNIIIKQIIVKREFQKSFGYHARNQDQLISKQLFQTKSSQACFFCLDLMSSN